MIRWLVWQIQARAQRWLPAWYWRARAEWKLDHHG